MITIQCLTTPAIINDACALLHEVYIQQQNWQFTSDNPAELRSEIRNNKKVLVERFSDSAVWFGAYDGEQLVGCVRLFSVDEDKQSEVKNCTRSQSKRLSIPSDEIAQCYEIQRMAIKKEYERRGIVKRLLLTCFQYAQENQFHLLTLTHNGYLKSLFKKIAFPMKREHAFRYEPQAEKSVNLYFADFKKSEVGETLEKLVNMGNDIGINANSIIKALQVVEPILPTPFYWMSPEGVVLGINELCLKAMGATREIIGKTPYAFYRPEIAEHILKHNAEVISKEEISAQEEWMEDVTTKERKCFSSIKAPLYDDEGSILGIVGTSIEITAQKELEQLRLENERQRTALLQEKEKIIALAQKLHMIFAPP